MTHSADEIIYTICEKYNGDWDKIFNHINAHKPLNNAEFKEPKENFISILSDKYPEGFKQVNKPPIGFNYLGNMSLVSEPRKTYIISDEWVRTYDILLMQNYIPIINIEICNYDIIDKLIDASKPFICVGSCPVDKIADRLQEYCKEGKALAISEAFNFKSDLPNALMCVRLCIGLADRILIVNARENEQNAAIMAMVANTCKEIIAVPQSINSSYRLGNQLIADGAASLLLKAEDLSKSE